MPGVKSGSSLAIKKKKTMLFFLLKSTPLRKCCFLTKDGSKRMGAVTSKNSTEG